MLPGSQVHTISLSPWQDVKLCNSGECAWVNKLYPIWCPPWRALRFKHPSILLSCIRPGFRREMMTMSTSRLQIIMSSTSFRVPILFCHTYCITNTINLIAANKVNDPVDEAAFCVILGISLSWEAKKVWRTPTCRRYLRRIIWRRSHRTERGDWTGRSWGKDQLPGEDGQSHQSDHVGENREKLRDVARRRLVGEQSGQCG